MEAVYKESPGLSRVLQLLVSSASSVPIRRGSMKEGAVQAARTITAFAVAILSCIVLWYSNVHKCASFFFAWQGLFPMQVERLPGLLCLCT